MTVSLYTYIHVHLYANVTAHVHANVTAGIPLTNFQSEMTIFPVTSSLSEQEGRATVHTVYM